ncbi:hypothetical protein Micbo1qcDRAFT_167052, partial [Microdochium bolleyi]
MTLTSTSLASQLTAARSTVGKQADSDDGRLRPRQATTIKSYITTDWVYETTTETALVTFTGFTSTNLIWVTKTTTLTEIVHATGSSTAVVTATAFLSVLLSGSGSGTGDSGSNGGNNASSPSSSRLSREAWIGVGIGTGAVVIFLLVSAVLCLRRHRRQRLGQAKRSTESALTTNNGGFVPKPQHHPSLEQGAMVPSPSSWPPPPVQ